MSWDEFMTSQNEQGTGAWQIKAARSCLAEINRKLRFIEERLNPKNPAPRMDGAQYAFRKMRRLIKKEFHI